LEPGSGVVEVEAAGAVEDWNLISGPGTSRQRKLTDGVSGRLKLTIA
jgi:hypothetical protein